MHFLKNIITILLFALAISFNQSCTSPSFGQRADSLFLVTDHVDFTYNLKVPNQKYFMPYVLEEISGLSFKQPNTILAIDDESGKMFEYNISEKNIIHSIAFNKSGDYEGIEMVNNEVFVLKSDGDLFQFPYGENKQTKAIKFENKLSSKNDTEGLGYDPKTNQLLIACKEKAGIEDSEFDGRAFYSVDIDKMKLNEKPAFIIGPNELKAFWEENRSFNYEKDRIKFKPSAIAAHPITGHLYILSSVGKMLVVVDSNGEIQATYPVSPRILGQPEGLCFAPNGDMFISSEGEGDRGYIIKFKMKKS
ncbi:SdiA-regulated domain-containing protein [Ekhidna sp.]